MLALQKIEMAGTSDYANLIRRANARWTWEDQTLQ
jgi:hypothetical protein